MELPDYDGGSIVNLMSSIEDGSGGKPLYPHLRQLGPDCLKGFKHIILIVIDGLGDVYLNTRKDSFLLKRRVGKITSMFPSTTATCVTTFATGVAAKQHGITGWFTYLRELGSIAQILPFLPRGGGTDYTLLGVGRKEVYTAKNISDRIKRKSHQIIPHAIMRNPVSETKSYGYSTLQGFSRQMRRSVRDAEKSRKKSVHYAYWPVFDKISHLEGIGSNASAHHFDELDIMLKGLKAWLPKNTVAIVTADHGHIDTTLERTILLKDHPEFEKMLTMPLCGEPRAAYCYVRPKYLSAFKTYVKKNLSHACWLKKSDELVEKGWYGLYDEHQRLRERIGDYVLVMKENYVIKDEILSEERSFHIGNHGGVSTDEMHVPLILL